MLSQFIIVELSYFKVKRERISTRLHTMYGILCVGSEGIGRSRLLLLALTLLVLLVHHLTIAHYHITKVKVKDSNSPEKSVFHYYLVHRETARLIPDENTLRLLGFRPEDARHISSKFLGTFKKGPNIEAMIQHNASPDEIMRIELLKNKILQGRLMANITYIGEYINPSVTPFCGRFFLAVGLAWGFVEGKAATEHLEFRWVNHTLNHFANSGMYYGVQDRIDNLDVPLIGQDPRMITDGDKLYLVFTYRYSNPVSMGAAEIVCNHTTKTVNVTNYDVSIVFFQEPYNNQKNWSPFLYKKELLLIQRINPLVVVKIIRPPNNAQKYGHMVSTAPKVEINWKYGEIRGGTNAVFLGDKYLAFFHSSSNLPGNSYHTYFMGAYTFSAHPPFHLLAFSPMPIMDDLLYTGAWNPLKNRHIDYVPFPSTCFLHGNDEVILSFGFQDHIGMTASLRLKHLLNSLENIGHDLNDKFNSTWTNDNITEDTPRFLRRYRI